MKLLAILLLPLVGCASNIDAARATLTTMAYAIVQTDQAFAAEYQNASEAARESSTNQAEKDAKMADWDRAADVIDGTYAALAVAEIGLDVWQATDDATDWSEAVCSLIDELHRLARVLEERNVRIPAALAKALSVVSC